MSWYTLALFVHESGAIGVFGGLSAYLFGAAALRRMQRVEEVRLLARLVIAASTVAVGSIVALGVAGLYMAMTVWGLKVPAWLIVATVSFILLAPGGMLVIDPRLKAIAKQAREAPDGPLPDSLARRVRDPLLTIALSTYIACLFGIVFLMANKPAMEEAIAAMLIAIAAGLLVSLALWRSGARKRGPERTRAPVSSRS